MKLDKIAMTVDADVDSNKVVDAAVDNDVDRIIELDPDMTYIRSYVDNMEIVDESYIFLRETTEVPNDFVKFAQSVITALADKYDEAAYKLNTEVKDKAKTQYKIIINRAEDIDKLRDEITKKFNLTKIIEDGKEIIYGKLASGKEHLYSIKATLLNTKDMDEKNDRVMITVTCHKLDKGILKKLSDEGKNLIKKAKTKYEEYLEGSYGKQDMIDYTAVEEHTVKERSHDEDYLKIVYEYCDLSDPEFKKRLIYVNEAEQNKVLMSLTAKLYANIVDKANEIDYGDIPETKGDITKLKNYGMMVDTVATLRDIVKEFKQDPKAVNVISEAIANVETRKDEFTKAFRLGYEIPKLIYCTTVLAINDSIAYMIASCIEFIKTPKTESFDMVLDVMRYKKAKDYLIFSNLDKLNREFKNGNIDKIMKAISKGAVDKAMTEAVDSINLANPKVGKNKLSLAGGILVGVALAVVGFILFTILGIFQDMVFYWYNTQNKYSQYLEMQAMVMEANANNLDVNHPEWDDAKKKEVYDRQMKLVDKWRNRAEKWRVTAKKAEVDTERELKNIKKLDSDAFEDASKYDSSLF
jgi:hypothetical protein